MNSEIIAHYDEQLGANGTVDPFRLSSGEEILVGKWSDENKWGVFLYATAGSYSFYKGAQVISEYYVGLSHEVRDMEVSLMRLVAAHFGDPLHMPAMGDTYTTSECQPLWEGTHMTAFMVVDVGPQIFADLTIRKTRIIFQKLIPLYASELQRKMMIGYEAFLREMELAEVDYVDPFRQPLI